MIPSYLYRTFVILCFFLSAGILGAEQLRIGFWNIRDLSVSSRDREEFGQIASVLKNFDCLAICELNDGEALDAICEILNREGGRWANTQTRRKVGNSPHSAEHYGFIYRSDKLQIQRGIRALREKTLDLEGGQAKFDREPAVCSFVTRDRTFDFTMIVCHVTWGQSVAARKSEIRALKQYFEEVQASNRRDDDVILCGDFNRNVGDEGSLTELLRIPTMVDTTSRNIPTIINNANTYDHLLLQRRFTTEYSGRRGVYRFDEQLFGNDDRRARIACSDHRPIWALFNTPARDDDP